MALYMVIHIGDCYFDDFCSGGLVNRSDASIYLAISNANSNVSQ